MLKGYVTIDTIESVLGGDTYKTYKDTVDNKTAMQKEFDTLNKMKQGEMTGEQTDRRAELKQQLEELKNNSKTSEIKSKLSEDVYNLVKDSRLPESYNEKTRRGQAFQADLSKYDTKQQETIKKAIESGILNNTNRTHEFVDMVAKISADKGVLFDFTSSQKLKESGFAIQGKTINGLITAEGNIAVNVNSAKALNSVVGHEIAHVFEGTELYKALQKSIIEYAKTKGEYQARFDEISKLYEGIEGANIENELIADLVGDYLFADSDFISRLSTENRNVFQKVYDEIKYLCKIATAGSKEARELEKVKRAFEKAYRENKNTTGEGGVRYSLQYETAEINDDIVSLVKKVKINDYKDNNKVELGTVSEKAAKEIKKLFDVDVSDYKIVIEARQIYHILKDHGINGKSDHSMSNDNDIAKMEIAFNDFDKISAGGRTKAYTYMKNGHNRTAPTVLYEKEIGEKSYYVVQAVPETKKRTLYVVTAFIGKEGYKKEASQLINASSLDVTAKTGSVVTSNNIITNSPKNVKQNTNLSLSSENTTPQKHGDYNVSGEEVMLQPEEDIAPVRADIKDNTPSESVAEENNATDTPTKRSELHNNIVENIKTKFTEKGFCLFNIFNPGNEKQSGLCKHRVLDGSLRLC